MSKAMDDVLAERRRQIEVEGWTAEHDNQHAPGELAMAGACYAAHSAITLNTEDYSIAQSFVRRCWPWAREWWKPKDKRRDMVRAAALMIAEIERIDRAAECSKEVTA